MVKIFLSIISSLIILTILHHFDHFGKYIFVCFRLEEDIALKPEWTEAYEEKCLCDVQRYDW